MSYFSRWGLAYHNFMSAAVGIVLAIAFLRGIARRQVQTIGNFWVILSAVTFGFSCRFALLGPLYSLSQGVVQNLKPLRHSKAG